MYSHIFKNHASTTSTVNESPITKKQTDDSKKFAKELGALKYGLYQQDKIVAAREEARYQRTGVHKNANVTTYGSLSQLLAEMEDVSLQTSKSWHGMRNVKA